MNDTLKTIYNHASVRNFSDREVSEDTLQQILKAACSGSTMGNMQLFSIIVTRDEEMKRKLAPAHCNQPVATQAPLMLTFCADFHRFNQYCKFRQADTEAYSNMQSYQWAVTDALIAAQNASVAAESLGLGICWLGTITYNVDQFVKILQLPKHVIPVACVTMGYPAVETALTQKLPMDAIVHREIYQDYSEERINNIYAEQEQSEATQQILQENALPNLAQVITQKRFEREDNEHFSRVLMETLARQEFFELGFGDDDDVDVDIDSDIDPDIDPDPDQGQRILNLGLGLLALHWLNH